MFIGSLLNSGLLIDHGSLTSNGFFYREATCKHLDTFALRIHFLTVGLFRHLVYPVTFFLALLYVLSDT